MGRTGHPAHNRSPVGGRSQRTDRHRIGQQLDYREWGRWGQHQPVDLIGQRRQAANPGYANDLVILLAIRPVTRVGTAGGRWV